MTKFDKKTSRILLLVLPWLIILLCIIGIVALSNAAENINPALVVIIGIVIGGLLYLVCRRLIKRLLNLDI